MISYPNFCSVWWFSPGITISNNGNLPESTANGYFFPFPSEGIPPFPYFEEGRERGSGVEGGERDPPWPGKGSSFSGISEKKAQSPITVFLLGVVLRQSYWEVSVRTAAVTAHHSCKPTNTKFPPHELNDLGEQTTSLEI